MMFRLGSPPVEALMCSISWLAGMWRCKGMG